MLVTCLLYNALRFLRKSYMLVTCDNWIIFFLSKTGASSSKALTLETSNGGRIWNLSAMTGWLASKCLSSPVPVKDVVKFDHCVCQAVVIQVHGISGRHAVRVHMSCRREVEINSGNFFCKKCKVTHLNEMLNKPNQLVSLNPSCIFSVLLSIYFLLYWQGEFVQQSKLLRLAIISFILVTLMFDSRVIL